MLSMFPKQWIWRIVNKHLWKAAQSVFCWSYIIWYLKFRTFETRHLGARIRHQHITMSQHSDCYGLHLCLPLWVGWVFVPPFQEPVAASSPSSQCNAGTSKPPGPNWNGTLSSSIHLNDFGEPSRSFSKVSCVFFSKNLGLVGGFKPFEKYESKWESSPNK